MKGEGIHYLRIYKVKDLGLVGGSMDITVGQVHQIRKR